MKVLHNVQVLCEYRCSVVEESGSDNMGRAEVLLKELNRGLDITSKTNTFLEGWTPNNLKRVVIGDVGAIVEYHCVPSGSKFSKLVNIVKFHKHEYEKDVELCMKKHYRGILSCLSEDRVNSCIEEIVFCTDSCGLYCADIDEFMTRNKNLLTKFPRLRYVSVIDLSIEGLLMKLSKDTSRLRGGLLTEMYKDFLERVVYEGPEDYKTKTLLRPQHYKLDEPGGLLSQRLRKVELEYVKEKQVAEEENLDRAAVLGVIKGDADLFQLLVGVDALYKKWQCVAGTSEKISSPTVEKLYDEFTRLDNHLIGVADVIGFSLESFDLSFAIKTIRDAIVDREDIDPAIDGILLHLGDLYKMLSVLQESRVVNVIDNVLKFNEFLRMLVMVFYVSSVRAVYTSLKYLTREDLLTSYRGLYKYTTGSTEFNYNDILNTLLVEDEVLIGVQSNAKEQFGKIYTVTNDITVYETASNLITMINAWVNDNGLYVSKEVRDLGKVE